MPNLTPRQTEVLEAIREHVRVTGVPPTHRELAEILGIEHHAAARDHLRALVKKGAIEFTASMSRGIRILADDNDPAMSTEGMLPLIGRVAAGLPVLASENIEEWIRVDASLFRPRADFLYRVQGNSMNLAGINDGDYASIHAQPVADSGQIIVAEVEDRETRERAITLKSYRPKGNVIRLEPKSDDPDNKPILIRPGVDYFAIQGIYVGLIRRG